jgi:hypothetical protein
MLLCQGSKLKQRSNYEKDADSLHPDRNRIAGAVRNNRYGRGGRSYASVLAGHCLSEIRMEGGGGW